MLQYVGIVFFGSSQLLFVSACNGHFFDFLEAVDEKRLAAFSAFDDLLKPQEVQPGQVQTPQPEVSPAPAQDGAVTAPHRSRHVKTRRFGRS